MRTQSMILFVLGMAAFPTAAQNLPSGPAKETFENVCSQCHGLDIIVSEKHTQAEWKAIVNTMANYGASAKDDEFDAIIDYLAKNFGKADTAANFNRPPSRIK